LARQRPKHGRVECSATAEGDAANICFAEAIVSAATRAAAIAPKRHARGIERGSDDRRADFGMRRRCVTPDCPWRTL